MEMTKQTKEVAKNVNADVAQIAKEMNTPLYQLEMKKKELKERLAYMRAKDSEPVQGVFRFYEVPGGTMSFSYKAYDGDQVIRYDLTDGVIYSVPLGVAKHLNKNIWYPEYAYVPSDGVIGGYGGNQAMRATKKVRRCGFQSLEFVDVDDVPTQVTQVEYMR